MADNTRLPQGTQDGSIYADDEITDGGVAQGARVQRVKSGHGTDGNYKDTSATDPLPVTAASLPLPAGAAQEHTAAASPHAARLTDGAAFYKATTPADTQPISAASLPLPTGAATAALQTQPGVDIGDVTVNNGAGAAAVNVQDGGNSLTTDTPQLPAALVGGRLDVVVGAALPAGGNAIGSVDTELPAAAGLADGAGNPSTPTVGAATLLFNGTTWDRARGDVANGIDVDVTRLPAPLTIVGNGAAAAALRVTLANDSTGTVVADTELPAAAALADGAGNPTTPTVGAANLAYNGTTWDRVRGDTANGLDVDVTRVQGTVTVDSELPAAAALADGAGNPTTPTVGAGNLAFNGTTWDRVRGDVTNGLDVDVTRSALPTGASTLAEQQTQTTALQLIDDTVHAANAALGKVNAIGAQMDDAATTAATENNVSALRINSDRALHVNLRSGAAEVGTSGAPLRTDPTGTTAQPVTQATAANLNAEVQGDAAHGAAVTGNPVLVGLEARSALPTAVSSGQAVRAQADLDGRLVVTPHSQRELTDDANITLTDATETDLFAAGGAGIFLDLVMVRISNGSSAIVRVDLRDSAAGTVRHSIWAAANGGGEVIAFPVPKKQAAANNKWTAQLSGVPVSNDVRITAQAVRRH